MCEHKILAHTERDYISRCETCGKIHIGFGTAVVCMTEEQFEGFKLVVKSQYKHYDYFGFTQQKITRLPTFSSTVLMTVNQEELEQLANLINEAEIIREVQQLISINK